MRRDLYVGVMLGVWNGSNPGARLPVGRCLVIAECTGLHGKEIYLDVNDGVLRMENALLDFLLDFSLQQNILSLIFRLCHR